MKFNSKRTCMFVFFIMLLFSSQLYGQQQTVSGIVMDAGTQEVLPGVNVVIKGTSIGTATNAEGEFELIVESLQNILVFTFIGYQTQEVPIDGRTELNVSLAPQIFTGDEVFVVGYGTQTRETLTGSVSRVEGSEIETVPATNISNSIAGRLPGLSVVGGSGQPGNDSSTLLIRGAGTLNDNNPLIVIDGVPNRRGGLDRLNPQDIESINVLKDASAAIYGAQAANGVILVTTKRGRVGEPEFKINIEQGFQNPTRLPDMADAPTYMQMVNEIDMFQDRSASFSQDQIQCSAELTDPWRCFNTNWFDEVMKSSANQTKADMMISGGSETTQYFISAGGQLQDGIFKDSGINYNQANLRVNLDNQVNDNFKVNVDISGRMEDRTFLPISTNQLFQMLMLGKPNEPAVWPNGLPAPDIVNGFTPVVSATEASGRDNRVEWFFQSTLNMELEVPQLPGLSLRGSASFDKSFLNRTLWQLPVNVFNFTGDFDEENNAIMASSTVSFSEPQLLRSSNETEDILLHLSTSYIQNLEDHSFRMLLGGEWQQFGSQFFNAFRRNFPTQQIDQLFAGGQDGQQIDGNAFRSRRVTAFSRINYDFRSKYLLELVGRIDGSFIFPEGNRYGFFPAVSAGWRLTQEDWFQEFSGGFFDEFKLRGSWGRSGNDRIEAFQFLQTFGFAQGFVFNENEINPGLLPTQLPNPNITWEVATQRNIGIDAMILENRLAFELDYFNNKRSDILAFRNASIPRTAGFILPRENIGEVSSWGYDGSILYRQEVSSDFNFGIHFNLAYAENQIDFFDEPPGAPVHQLATGSRMDTQLYFRAIGVFQSEEEIANTPSYPGAQPGDLIFEDVNGDGVINSDDMVRINKSMTPKWTGGLGLNGNFKHFDFNIFFQGAAGAHVNTFTQSGNIGNFFAEFAKNRWTPNNPSNSYPRVFNREDEFWAANQNTFFLRNTDYIRLKSLEIGYTLPVNIASSLGIRNLRVFVSGFNLATFFDDLKDLGLDPESAVPTNVDGGNIQGAGPAGFEYPIQRIFNSGISITF
ncbi:TonB-dependent receptor [soil metagenome]